MELLASPSSSDALVLHHHENNFDSVGENHVEAPYNHESVTKFMNLARVSNFHFLPAIIKFQCEFQCNLPFSAQVSSVGG